jgi:hypothetical protein
MRLTFIFLALLACPGIALAYVGPGLGAGAIGVVLGLIASVFLALFALFWYPIKRLLKKRKAKPPTVVDSANPGADDAGKQGSSR